MEPKIILGIDPGIATTGVGIIESAEDGNHRAKDWAAITTEAGKPQAERLQELKNDLMEYIEEHKPELAVVEKLFFTTNQKTALIVAEARGVIILCLAEKQIPILEITPLQLKSGLTGDGKADKKQVQEMLRLSLKLDEIPEPDDAADALALALYGALIDHTSNSI